MRVVIWTTPALRDVRSVELWLMENRLGDFAERMLVYIRDRAAILETLPHIGRPSADGLRVLRVLGTPYLILYRVGAEIVEVIRVRHEREDWQLPN